MIQLVFYVIFLILLFSIMGKIIYDYRGAKQLPIPMTYKRWPSELGWIKMAKMLMVLRYTMFITKIHNNLMFLNLNKRCSNE